MRSSPRPPRRPLAALALLLALSPAATGTWSISVTNELTGEVCIATASCVGGANIVNVVPAIVVGKGGGCAQGAVPLNAEAKKKMVAGLMAGQTPAQILVDIRNTISSLQVRQYGIVDLESPPVGFTGTNLGDGKKHVAGQVGNLRYAIAGNVLTGPSVVDAIEATLISAPGDLGQKVMASMETARSLGGDGRCSCSQSQPTSCGVPPPSFTKSAHTAAIVLARVGDTDGVCTGPAGCANGDYYLRLSIAGNFTDPDPVLELQSMYDAWRDGLAGHPDGILSTASPAATNLVADGVTHTTVTVQLVDVEGVPLTAGGASLAIAPVGGGPALATAGPVTDHGDGSYSFDVTAGTVAGSQAFEIAVDDGQVQATLYPHLELAIDPLAPLHAGLDELSGAAGGAVPFVLNAGAANGALPYVLLASASGTAPGVPLSGGTLPLNPDAVTDYTLAAAGPPALPGSVGLTDANGRAEAMLVAPPGLLGALAGLDLDWAAVVFSAPETIAGPVGLDIVP